MAKRKPELVRRQLAIAKTMKRFGGKAFRLGANDCAKLAAFHLKAMGHRNLPTTGNYDSEFGAAKQVKKLGFDNLEQLFDELLERIPPAAMLPGDLAMPPSDPDAPASKLGTVMVMASGRKFLGWHPDFEQLALMELLQIDAAWRV